MICLADKLSNMRMSANMHRVKGDEMWQIFNQKDKREQEWYYRSIYENLLELADTAAYKEYVELCNQVFV
jgi:myo-inositol-1(or 4)-monophosphatase